MPLFYHCLAFAVAVSLFYIQYLTHFVYFYPTFFLMGVIYFTYLQAFYLPDHTNNEARFVYYLNLCLIALSSIGFCTSLIYPL